MLGRRRTKGYDRINLYAEVPTIQKDNKSTANVSEKITAIKRAEKAHDEIKTLQRMWNEGKQEINSFTCLDCPTNSKRKRTAGSSAKVKRGFFD